jgi:hypothetical protein
MGHSLEEKPQSFTKKTPKKVNYEEEKKFNSKRDCRTHVLIAATDVGEALKKEVREIE